MGCSNVARDGDVVEGNGCSGIIIATATQTLVNCIPVARKGDPWAGDDCKGTITEGAEQTFAECIEVARIGDKGFCTVHNKEVIIVTGSPDTFAK